MDQKTREAFITVDKALHDITVEEVEDLQNDLHHPWLLFGMNQIHLRNNFLSRVRDTVQERADRHVEEFLEDLEEWELNQRDS